MASDRAPQPLRTGRGLVVGAIVGIVGLIAMVVSNGFSLWSLLAGIGVLVVVLGGCWIIMALVNRGRTRASVSAASRPGSVDADAAAGAAPERER